MANKKSHVDFIQQCIKVHNNKYDYSKTVYVSDSSPITVICKTHGEWTTLACSHLRSRSGCPSCANNKKLTTEEFIKRAVELHGDTYDYSKTEYVRALSKIKIICKIHGEFEQLPSGHLNGKGCSTCGTGRGRISTSVFVNEAIAIHGDKYDYSNSIYTKYSDKITIRCKKHDFVFKQLYASHITRKAGCPLCAGKTRKTTEKFIEEAQSVHGDRYDYGDTVYQSYMQPLQITCKVHGAFFQSPNNHIRGATNCPKCTGRRSKACGEIADFLSQHTNIKLEFKFDKSARAIDIFLPEHNLGIEFNGNYWHSTAVSGDHLRDYKKHKDAAAIGIRIIHIFEDEWLLKPEILQRTLLSAMGIQGKIYARNCEIKHISDGEASDFYTKYHIQGRPNGGQHIGLLFQNKIVAAMSFSQWRSNRNNTDRGHVELTRYASGEQRVIGGAGKLLKAFISGSSDIHTITSYSDNRMFSGSMYQKLGFNMMHKTKPDYAYTNGNAAFGRKHKSGFQKKHLQRLFPNCDTANKTEREICHENGLYQIFDCGKTRWDLKIG